MTADDEARRILEDNKAAELVRTAIARLPQPSQRRIGVIADILRGMLVGGWR